tara:strand:+ start:2914 stop:3798 length:885 start_codon:yes stop_codon:yes gene_type:complete
MEINLNINHKIGILGLGVLGSAIAQCFIDKKINIFGFDISSKFYKNLDKNFITILDDISKFYTKCNIVITCLPSEESLLEVTKNLNSKILFIETSTLPLECKKLAKSQLNLKDCKIVDAPLSGNRLAALEGKLSSYLSGMKNDKSIASNVLNIFCHKVTDVGDFGNGIVMKLIGNILNLVHNAVTAEVLTLGMKSGLKPEIIHEAISGTFSSSGVFENRGKLMVDQDFEKEGMNFSTPLKDSKFITELSRSNLVALPIYQVALQYYYSAVANGLGDKDASSIIRILERNTNFRR